MIHLENKTVGNIVTENINTAKIFYKYKIDFGNLKTSKIDTWTILDHIDYCLLKILNTAHCTPFHSHSCPPHFTIFPPIGKYISFSLSRSGIGPKASSSKKTGACFSGVSKRSGPGRAAAAS